MARVVIIGCGNVGMSFAYQAVTQRNKISELVLIDIDRDKACGEAQDLKHAAVYNKNNVRILPGKYSDCARADIIVIAAGEVQGGKQTRAALVKKNAKMIQSIVDKVSETAFNGVYLVVTNPVDVMSHLVKEHSKLPYEKVIGSGTTLDTARLRYHISKEIGIDPRNIHAYVLGEHGDSAFVPWSCCVIGLNRAEVKLTEEQRSRILYHMRTDAYDIINKKGSTYYGIGVCMLDIVDAILEDAKSIKTVSSYCKSHDVYMGQPTILGNKGIERVIAINLPDDEAMAMEKSAEAIRKMMRQI